METLVSPSQTMSKSYMNRGNLEYIDSLYKQFQNDPSQVDPNWRAFFEGMEFGADLKPSTHESAAAPSAGFDPREIKVFELIRAYREYGHLKATLDPLGFAERHIDFFNLQQFGLTSEDLNREFKCIPLFFPGLTTLKALIDFCERKYCGTLALQISECEPEVRSWFQEKMENSQFELSPDQKREVFKSLAKTEALEKFLHTRFVGKKRFSIEGADALLPMLEHFLNYGCELNVEELVIGMAHRGRINVLANFMGKALEIILAEFEGIGKDKSGLDGDVKYHMGFSADKVSASGRSMHISLAFNPSHLEAVNPVVLGMTRAKQRKRKNTEERDKVVPILVHGDAAFSGQGVVTETLQMSQLTGYRVGGTIHVILNNQVGFTTDPEHSRSSRYSSDMAKMIKAPIMLVNGDDVEACVRAMAIALEFRQKFKQDVVIDLICYRRFGHNEGDEPAFTQPRMYETIKRHPSPMKIYADQLARSGVLPATDSEAFYQQKLTNLQNILESTRSNPPEIKPQAYSGLWQGLRPGAPADFTATTNTKISPAELMPPVRLLTEAPNTFSLHPKIKKLIEQRHEMLNKDQLDWAMGELLAYGSLIQQGFSVRISGQDAKRGTFTHRQAVYFSAEAPFEYTPLAELRPDREFCIYNSPLSEMAVLGFEYGNAIADPTFLTVWEAQFGDFANGAQIIIDQFLSSGEQKWARTCGLVLLLPHGYEGQGPEHSSARLERFLQLCAQENLQVCNLTTPANLFHALRRQMLRDFRKPLVIMSPKSLLRHPKAVSSMKDLTDGQFFEVLSDPSVPDLKSVEHLILCSGKLFYELDTYREAHPQPKTAILRIEQLYPYPKMQLTPYLNGLAKLKKITWAQEEPKNMGAYLEWTAWLREHLDELGLNKLPIRYVGRTRRASPAVGNPKVHDREQQQIIVEAFS